jgi:predicted acyl esterase
MKDGVHIACDMYRPEKPGKYPALFASSPYIKDSIDLPSTSMYRYCELLSHRA